MRACGGGGGSAPCYPPQSSVLGSATDTMRIARKEDHSDPFLGHLAAANLYQTVFREGPAGQHNSSESKALPTEPDNLGLNPRTCMLEGENWSLQADL